MANGLLSNGVCKGFLQKLNCIYTTGNENDCRKYRNLAEMLRSGLHFIIKSIKV